MFSFGFGNNSQASLKDIKDAVIEKAAKGGFLSPITSFLKDITLEWGDVPTALATTRDGRPLIVLGRGFFLLHVRNKSEAADVVLHEIMHHVFLHLARSEHYTKLGYSFYLQNLAMDAIINAYLARFGCAGFMERFYQDVGEFAFLRPHSDKFGVVQNWVLFKKVRPLKSVDEEKYEIFRQFYFRLTQLQITLEEALIFFAKYFPDAKESKPLLGNHSKNNKSNGKQNGSNGSGGGQGNGQKGQGQPSDNQQSKPQSANAQKDNQSSGDSGAGGGKEENKDKESAGNKGNEETSPNNSGASGTGAGQGAGDPGNGEKDTASGNGGDTKPNNGTGDGPGQPEPQPENADQKPPEKKDKPQDPDEAAAPNKPDAKPATPPQPDESRDKPDQRNQERKEQPKPIETRRPTSGEKPDDPLINPLQIAEVFKTMAAQAASKQARDNFAKVIKKILENSDKPGNNRDDWRLSKRVPAKLNRRDTVNVERGKDLFTRNQHVQKEVWVLPDVSASMTRYLPFVVGLLKTLKRRDIKVRIACWSEKVQEMPVDEMISKNQLPLGLGMGTNGEALARFMNKEGIKEAVIITDNEAGLIRTEIKGFVHLCLVENSRTAGSFSNPAAVPRSTTYQLKLRDDD